MKTGNEIYKISYTGNGLELVFFVNLSDICVILRIILEYWIQYCMSYVHDISISGHF